MSVVGRASMQRHMAAMCRFQIPNQSDVIVNDLVTTGHISRDRTCFRLLEETEIAGRDCMEHIVSRTGSSMLSGESFTTYDVENLGCTHLPFGGNGHGSRAGVGPSTKREKEHLTLGWRFRAVDAFEAKPMKALTARFSSFGAPPRNALRMRSFVRTCLILADLRSISRRSFLRGSASGCHSPPPLLGQQEQLTVVLSRDGE